MTFLPTERCCRRPLAPCGGRVSGFEAPRSASPGTAEGRAGIVRALGWPLMVQVGAAGGRPPQFSRCWQGCGARGSLRVDSLTARAAESAGVAPDDLGRVTALSGPQFPLQLSDVVGLPWVHPAFSRQGNQILKGFVQKRIQVIAFPPWAEGSFKPGSELGSMFAIIM